MSIEAGIGRQAIQGLIWSAVQSWGGRLLTFVLFLILARLLTPAEFGLASTVALIVLLLSLVAEFGFGEALIQRRTLERRDVTLPFIVSMSLSVGIATGIALLSPSIERWSAIPGLAPCLMVACLGAPISTASMFQEALFKREMRFRALALRLLVATAISGAVGIACAFAGLGALSLIIQAIVLVACSAVWLWSQPVWLPTRAVNRRSFFELARYSINVVCNRMLDFGTTRTIDALILMLHGVTAFGLYTVGSRVYQTLMQLLTTVVMDVSLSALSRIAHDPERMAAAYRNSIALSAFLATPVFVGLAATSPDLSLLLFGPKWSGSDAVMRPLLLIGAVQTVQFVNGAYFGALGKPHYVLGLNLAKFCLVVPALLLLPTRSVVEMTWVYVAAQLLITPLTFALSLRTLRIGWTDFLSSVGLFFAAAALAFFVVLLAHRGLGDPGIAATTRLLIEWSIYGVVYLACITLLARERVLALLNFSLERVRRSRART